MVGPPLCPVPLVFAKSNGNPYGRSAFYAHYFLSTLAALARDLREQTRLCTPAQWFGRSHSPGRSWAPQVLPRSRPHDHIRETRASRPPDPSYGLPTTQRGAGAPAKSLSAVAAPETYISPPNLGDGSAVSAFLPLTHSLYHIYTMRSSFFTAAVVAAFVSTALASPMPANTSASARAAAAQAAAAQRAQAARNRNPNVFTGNAGDVNGGSVYRTGDPDLDNNGTGVGGNGGTSVSLPAYARPGGDAGSGNTGNANGGDIVNTGATITNTNGANRAGNGGSSTSGNAVGGDAPRRNTKRADGGNARTGNSGSVSGGSVVNAGSALGTVTNAGASSNGGIGGTTTTGNAFGGAASAGGNGGSARTGDAGTARGGGTTNTGGTINNGGGSSIGAMGGTSTSGNARGGAGGSFSGFAGFSGFN